MQQQSDQIEADLAHYQRVAQIYTQQEFPLQWCLAQCQLGIAYINRVTGSRLDNLNHAVIALSNVVNVCDRNQVPDFWAACNAQLASANMAMVVQGVVEAIDLAINGFEKILESYPSDTFPDLRAGTLVNLGQCYLIRDSELGGEDLVRAVDSFERALAIWNNGDREKQRADVYGMLTYAHAQHGWPGPKDCLDQALSCYEQHLLFYTRDRTPDYWRLAQDHRLLLEIAKTRAVSQAKGLLDSTELLPFENLMLQRILKLVPDAHYGIAELNRLQKLGERDAEGAAVIENLFRILVQPRAPGVNATDVFWAVLERLVNPATNTQIVSVPFRGEVELSSATCKVAARIFSLISNQPGEYVRIVERLTSPQLRFRLYRQWEDAKEFEAKLRWFSNRTPHRVVDDQSLTFTVMPDANALSRAILEHNNRAFPDFDFGLRGRKNSRSVIDVLVQSALMNYSMHGEYDSELDTNQFDHTRGLPSGSYGELSLDFDIFGRSRIYFRGPAATDEDWAGEENVLLSPLDAPDAP